MDQETDFDDTWMALESAHESLMEVRAAHLTSDQHEGVRDAVETVENILQSIDDEISAQRAAKEDK